MENQELNKKSNQINKVSKWKKYIKPALIGTFSLTLITGIAYPIATTLVANTVFPYESNGSQIKVTLKDGTVRTYGSELIGQQYENPRYLFGRVNLGSPTNLNPTSQEYKDLIDKRINERREKLAKIGYVDQGQIPEELVTSSGSGVDPHISPKAAYYQVDVIVKAREKDETKFDANSVKKIIDKYTENPFLGFIGEKRVNVLMVNLALDGLI